MLRTNLRISEYNTWFATVLNYLRVNLHKRNTHKTFLCIYYSVVLYPRLRLSLIFTFYLSCFSISLTQTYDALRTVCSAINSIKKPFPPFITLIETYLCVKNLIMLVNYLACCMPTHRGNEEEFITKDYQHPQMTQ